MEDNPFGNMLMILFQALFGDQLTMARSVNSSHPLWDRRHHFGGRLHPDEQPRGKRRRRDQGDPL
jgi:hypothetical protein